MILLIYANPLSFKTLLKVILNTQELLKSIP